ncbi:hypothetical protein [Butyrivibrio sp. FCS014]|uniref:hypothetical protein n=1 Tax=Butyrivibrio sp. FCS014 TaxID=1408304 RepID=UPI000465A6FE|nr:hypothetical protein [Butyrivibrio sp. FCS014]
MSKKWNKVLAFLLAVALVVTTFGSDFANAKVYAAEGEDAAVEQQVDVPADNAEGKTFSEIKEDVEVPVDEIKEETAAASADESAVEGSTEQTTEEDEEEADDDEDASATDDSSEEASDENAEEAEEAEEAAEAVEKKLVGETEIDGIKIELFAVDGVLPEDAEVQISKVETEKAAEIEGAIEEMVDADEVDTFSFDINIWSPSLGQFVQPDETEGKVEVVFSEIEQAQSENAELAVYHVPENLDEIEKVGSADSNTATEVSFDTTHFSVYTVTITFKYGKKKTDKVDYSFKAKYVDTDGKEIDVPDSFKDVKVTIDDTGNPKEEMVPVKGKIAKDVDGYEFQYALYGTHGLVNVLPVVKELFAYPQFDYVKVVAGQRTLIGSILGNPNGLWAYDFDLFNKGLEAGQIGRIDSNRTIYFVYKKNKPAYDFTKTDDHLDLGLEKKDYEMYKNGGAKVSAIVNGTEYKMTANGEDSQMGTYEYRMWLGNYQYDYDHWMDYSGLATVSVNDTITYKVEYLGQVYLYNCTTAENQAASNACYEAHKSIQEIFGFDYKLKFTEAFKLTGDVIYHATTAATPNALPQISEEVNFGWNQTEKDYTVKDYTNVQVATGYSVQKLYENKIDKFLGWDTDSSAKTVVYAANAKIKVQKGSTLNLYAVWSSYDFDKTDDHLDLGLEKADYEMYRKGGAVVYAVVNGKEYPMTAEGEDKEMGTYEYRMWLGNYKHSTNHWMDYSGLDTVSVNDTISYIVEYNGQEYIYNCTTAENQKASNDCYNAHKAIQNIFGFDYKLKFTEQFDLKGDVIYHSNCDATEAGLDTIAETVKFGRKETEKDYFVKNYPDVKTGEGPKTQYLYENKVDKFLGWATTADAKVAEYKANQKIKVKKGDTLELYAVWDKYDFTKTDDHIDLGLTKEDFESYKKAGAKVSVIVNGTEYKKVTAEGEDKEMGTYEYRLWLGNYKTGKYSMNYSGLDTVSVNDKITFKVEVNKQVYIYNCTTEDNTKASLDCYEAHKKIQNIFGFDYKLTFTDVFELTGDVVYHANFDVKPGERDRIAEEIEFFWFQDEKDYTVKDYKNVQVIENWATHKLAEHKGYEFLGWALDPKAEKPDYKAGTVIQAKRDKQIDLYAVWKVKKAKIAVYATGPVKEETVNPNFAETLKVDYIQSDDGYYPIGVIEMDETFFLGKNYTYITNAADWEAVKEAFTNTFTTEYNAGKNLNNTVASNLQYVQVDYRKSENQHFTALFDWRWGASKTIQNADGQNYKYHLDLQFKTNEVDYVAVYPEGITDDLATSVVLTGSETTLPDTTVIDGKFDANKYDVVGYFTDAACTTEFAKDTYTVTSDTTIYVKLALKEKWKLIIALNLDSEGDNYRTVKYDGTKQEVNVDVTLDVDTLEIKRRSLLNSAVVTEAIQNVFVNFGSLFTLKVFAADVPDDWTELSEDITVLVNGEEKTYRVNNIFIEGGSGTTVGEYPVNLHTSDLVIKAVVDGEAVGENLADALFDENSIQIKTNVAPKRDAVSLLAAEEVKEDDEAPATEESGVYEIGKLTINKREVTLTSASASKTYDGTALSAQADPVQSYPDDQTFGFVDGEKVIYTNTTSVVGNPNTSTTVDNVFTYKFENEELASNYDVKVVYGKLTVNPTSSRNVTPPPSEPEPPTPPQVLGATRAPEGEVLGAQRQAAVLGARRGRTEDPTNNVSRIIVIVVAAGIAISIMFFGRKKEDGEE